MEKDANTIVTIIKQNIKRCMRDKLDNYPHNVALYNDLLRQIAPEYALTIEYHADDCRVLAEPIFMPGYSDLQDRKGK